MKRPSFSLGIEEEYQIIDPQTRELRSYITEFLEGGKLILREREIKPEMFQSVVELGTPVCETIDDARREILDMRSAIATLSHDKGLTIAAAGTHPFSHWENQQVTPFPRYFGVLEDMQVLARQLLIFGLHVHVGIEDPELRIDILNQVRYMLPHVLALSTSSPFWEGRKTGLKSIRSIIFEQFPRSGIPSTFTSWADFQNYVDLLVRTGSIDDGKRIWWDVRVHPSFPTLEFRICDMCTRVEEVLCIAALFQALCLKLYKLRRDNQSFRIYRTQLIQENKWRAIRYGIDGKLIDFGRQAEMPARDLVHEMVAFVDDVVDDLGCRREVQYAFQILRNGTSADRQLAVYDRTGGDMKAVVDHLVVETLEGVSVDWLVR
ncbi:MAG: carboxylate-amine ligase [Anaerolineae bacterium]|nr:carboxylate-amine ligase [Anaerolineae bacterium]